MTATWRAFRRREQGFIRDETAQETASGGRGGGRLAAAETGAAEGGANGGDEGGGIVLGNDSVETGAAGIGFESRGREDGVEQDGSVGKDGVNFAAGADAVANRHQNIEDDDVRLEFRGLLDGGAAIGSFAANLPVIAGFAQQFGDGPAQEVMVIRD